MERGHEALPCSPEAWSRGGDTSAVSRGSKAAGTNIRDGEDDLSVQETKEQQASREPCSTTLWIDRICTLRWAG